MKGSQGKESKIHHIPENFPHVETLAHRKKAWWKKMRVERKPGGRKAWWKESVRLNACIWGPVRNVYFVQMKSA